MALNQKTATLSKSSDTTPTKLLFIDGKLEDRDSLLAGLDPAIEVIVLDESRDGIQQISDVLAAHSDVDAVHIFSHGHSGSLSLGSAVLDNTSINLYSQVLLGWRESLSDGADLMLYGCNVAEGDQGETFIHQLAQLTGADVAASDDLTGSAALGGDWQLESRVGEVIQQNPLQPLTYQATLADNTSSYRGPSSASFSEDGDFISLFAAGSAAFDGVLKDGVQDSRGNEIDGLSEPMYVTASADGKSVYVASQGDDAISVFSRADDGSLSFSAILRDSDDGISGLQKPHAVAVSPDGTSVYVASFLNHSLSVFSRDADGNLAFVEVLSDTDVGIDGLNNASSVVVSPDGQYVYVSSSSGDNALTVFERAADDGRLTFSQIFKEEDVGINGLARASAVTVSADGKSIYVAAIGDDSVAFFIRGDDGSLSYQDMYQTSGLSGATSVSVSPDDKHVYVAAYEDNAISVFDRAENGELTLKQKLTDGANGVDGLGFAWSVAVSPDGQHVYVAAFNDNAVSVFSRAESGILSYQGLLKDGGTDSQGAEIDGLNQPRSITVSPDSASIYAIGSGDNGLVVITPPAAPGRIADEELDVLNGGLGNYDGASLTLSRNAGADASDQFGHSGTLEALTEGQDLTLDGTIIGTVTSNSGGTLLLSFNDQATTARVNSAFQQIQYSNSSDAPPASVQLDISLNNGSGNSTTVGSITVNITPVNDAPVLATDADPTLTAIDVNEQDRDNPGTLISDLLGDNLSDSDANAAEGIALTAAATDNGTWQYSIDNGSTWSTVGAVIDTAALLLAAEAKVRFQPNQDFEGTATISYRGWDKTSGSNGDSDVNVSDNGGSTAFSSATENAALTVKQLNDAPTLSGLATVGFTEDGAATKVFGTGVSFVEALENGGTDSNSTTLEGLGSVTATVLSPDGKHLYVVDYEDNLTVFSRADDNSLTLLESFSDSDDGIDGLNNPLAVTVSPDGKSVYVATQEDNSVAVFSRADDGRLTFVEVFKNGVDGVQGLTFSTAVIVSPDGKSVYSVGAINNSLALFDRADDGRLTYQGMLQEGTDGVTGLVSARSLAFSPDGQFLYVAAEAGKTVTVFSRDNDGNLSYLDQVKDGVDGVEGLDGAYSVTLSPDGMHVYVGSTNDSSVVTFSRANDGRLTFEQVLKDGEGGIDGLEYARSVVVSPDGKYVYAAGTFDNSLAAFERSENGQLTFVGNLKDGVEGVEGLGGPNAIAVSTDSSTIFVGGRGLSILKEPQPGEVVDEELDALNGGDGNYDGVTLTLSRNGGADTSDLFSHGGALGQLTEGQALSLDSTTIGTVTTNNDGTLQLSFNDQATTARVNAVLQQIHYSNNSDNPPASVTLDIVLNDGNSGAQGEGGVKSTTGSITINITAVNDAPVLSTDADVAFDAIDINEADADNPGSLISDLLGNNLSDVDNNAAQGIALTAAETDNGTWQYSIDNGSTWSTVGAVSDTAALLLAGDAKLRFKPNPDFEGSATISYRGWDQTSGNNGDGDVNVSENGSATAFSSALETATQRVTDVNDVPKYQGPSSASFTEDGDAVSLFSAADTAFAGVLKDGEQDSQGNDIDGLSVPTALAMSPDGKHIYTVATGDSSVAVFGREDDGSLVFIEALKDNENGIDGLSQPKSVTVSPDGKSVYVAGGDDNTLAVFSRADNGRLSFVEVFQDGQNGVDGLKNAQSVMTSPDGTHVYVVGSNDSAIAIFNRADDGQLTFADSIKQTFGSIDGLQYADSATISPDGKQVYVVSNSLDSVAVFNRADNGSLSFVEIIRQQDGLNGATAVTVSPDGQNVYVVSVHSDNGVVVFSRADDGRLTFVEVIKDYDSGVDGLFVPKSVSVSPDGDFVYIAASGDSAVSAFSRAEDGRLSYQGMLKQGETDQQNNTVDGLMNAIGVTVSPDGNYIYAVGQTSGALVTIKSPQLSGQIADVELDLLNDRAGNYQGAVLTIDRNGGADSNDQFSHSGTLGELIEGNDLVLDGTTVGIVSHNSGGSLQLTFNDQATTARVNSVLQQVQYSNSSDNPPSSVTLDITLNDGNTGAQGEGGNKSVTTSIAVTITPVNDAPTSADTTESVEYNSSYTFLTDDFAFNDGDGDSLNYIALTRLPEQGTLMLGDRVVSLNDHSGIAEIGADDISEGRLVYTPEDGGTGSGYADFGFRVNDGLLDSSEYTVTLDVAAPPSSGGGNSSGDGNTNDGSSDGEDTGGTTETVDGVDVETQVITDDDGNTRSTIKIDPVTTTRQEDNGTDNTDKADIPLRKEADGNAALTVALPTGVGITAEGNAQAQSAGDSIADLIRLIDETADDSAESQDKADMLQGGQSFLEALQDEHLWVNKITLSTSSEAVPEAPIVVSGNTRTTSSSGNDNSKAALVIDASTLPSGTVVQLQDVEFAVIVGPATITGGEGQNTVYAGTGSQTIILGADDDQLYGGDGNDTVGSKGGDDKLFGENGNDTLFGGAGADTLHGGADIDTVTYDGAMAEYDIVQQNGVITITNKADGTDSDTLVNVEQVTFADGNYLASYDTELKALATLYQNVLGRQADLNGFQWWAEQLDNGATFGDTILGFMQSSEYQSQKNTSFNELDSDQQLDAIYQAVLGRAADNAGKEYWQAAMGNGMNISDVAHSFASSTELLGQLQLSMQWDFTL